MSITIDYALGLTGLAVAGTAYAEANGDAAGVALTFTENTVRKGRYSVTATVGGAGNLVAGLNWIQISVGGSNFDSQFVKIVDGTSAVLLPSQFEANDALQTGDVFARIGNNGSGLTALGDARLANLDAAVSSRVKPSDTLAAVSQLGSEVLGDGKILPTVGAGSNQISLAAGYVYVGNFPAIPSAPAIAAAVAGVLFVDGATNQLKVNGDHSVNSTFNGTIQNNVVISPAVAAASANPAQLAIQNYCSVSITLPSMGVLAGRSDLRFSIKNSTDDADSAALITVSESGGLLTLAGAPAIDPTLATLTVANPSTTGDVTVFLKAAATAVLLPTNGIREQRAWGAKVIIGVNETEPIYGSCLVIGAVNRHF